MNINDVKKIAVLGSGAMGHGIAQVCIQAGYAVVMRDIKQEFLDNGVAKIKESLDFLVGKGKMARGRHGQSHVPPDNDPRHQGSGRRRPDRHRGGAGNHGPEKIRVQGSFRRLQAGRHPGNQHLHDEHIRNRRRGEKSRALRGPALLQPGQPDEAGGSHLRQQDQ